MTSSDDQDGLADWGHPAAVPSDGDSGDLSPGTQIGGYRIEGAL
ncbi:MAG: hypothetical protein ACR2MN_00385 [Acidimicrobiales bacterium]